jgi:hypothetical protein
MKGEMTHYQIVPRCEREADAVRDVLLRTVCMMLRAAIPKIRRNCCGYEGFHWCISVVESLTLKKRVLSYNGKVLGQFDLVCLALIEMIYLKGGIPIPVMSYLLDKTTDGNWRHGRHDVRKLGFPLTPKFHSEVLNDIKLTPHLVGAFEVWRDMSDGPKYAINDRIKDVAQLKLKKKFFFSDEVWDSVRHGKWMLVTALRQALDSVVVRRWG